MSQSKPNTLPVTPTPTHKIVEEALNSDNAKLNTAQQEILKRLQKLQSSMVGGERANDKELKEKRLRKKRAAERRLQALAQVLSKVEDEDKSGLMLGVYDDIQEEMKSTIRRHRLKIRAQEREITDLQGEFENERTDYLEMIRKQERQSKFYQQILDKILPTLKKDCNYCNLENIQAEAIWSEDAKSWTLPDLATIPTKLPPAAGISWGRRSPSQTAPGRLENDSSYSPILLEGSVLKRSSATEVNVRPIVDAWRKKLQKSEDEDFAGNYFKPKRATELLIKAKEEAGRVVGLWRETTVNKSSQNPPVPPAPTTNISGSGPLNPLPGQAFLNNSWGAGQMNNNNWTSNNNSRLSPELTRRPLKLQALPITSKKPSRTKGLNTLDMI